MDTTTTTPPPPPLPPPPPTPPRLTFHPIDATTLPHLKSLNAALFPVAYRDIFYHQCMAAGDLTHGAFDGGELVGAVAVRLEARKPEAGGGADAYVMTVGVLAPYRGRGIGTRLLTNVLHGAAADPNIHTCYLHVQTSNDDAIAFYTRLGFEQGGIVRGYYRRLDPPDAVVLRRRLR